MKNRNWKEWVKRAGIRAAKTFCQSFAGCMTGAVVLTDVDWKVALSTAALAGAYSVVTSLAGLPEVEGK